MTDLIHAFSFLTSVDINDTFSTDRSVMRNNYVGTYNASVTQIVVIFLSLHKKTKKTLNLLS